MGFGGQDVKQPGFYVVPKMWVQCGYISPLPKRKTHSEVSLSGLLVEIVGVEPTTLCLQSRCSSQLSYTPVSFLFVDYCVRLRILTPHNH